MERVINVIGLGPGDYEYMTLGALKLLKTYNKIYTRTEINSCVDYIKSLGIHVQSFDELYDKAESFEDLYSQIAQSLIDLVKKENNVLYAVPGSSLDRDFSIKYLKQKCDQQGVGLNILTGVSYVDAVLTHVDWDMDKPVKFLDTQQLDNRHIDASEQLIIGPLYDRFVASEVKIALIDFYGHDFEVQLVDLSGDTVVKKRIKIEYIDREDGSYAAYLFVPAITKLQDLKSFKFEDLLDIMDILRGADGCPWDKQQTYQSLKKYTFEEVYEVFDAVDSGDADKLCDELGDLMLQVVFYSRIAKEQNKFTAREVITAICKKMIERHTHIFANDIASDSDQVVANWEKNKRKKKGFTTYTQVMQDIPRNFPALLRSYKVQQKAALVGFDWDKVEDALDKVNEELNELKDAYFGENIGRIREEIGDLLFAVVNVARFFDIQPEFALNNAIDKFISRFRYIESQSIREGKNIEDMTLDEMDRLWDKAKQTEQNSI